MNAQNKTFVGIAVAALLGCATQVMAKNITIQDYNGGPTSPIHPGATWTFGGGAVSGVGGEDNETEYGTVREQRWDLEAFSKIGNKLYIIGGYDFALGAINGRPGDLFIKIGSAATYTPTSDPSGGTVLNSMYLYNYAVNLTGGLVGGGPVRVTTLSGTSVLNTVINDAFGSNPWKLNGTAGSPTTAMTYNSGLTATEVGTLTGVSGLLGYDGNNLHNVVGIDLGFLGSIPVGTEVFLSYTMECGNDSLKGRFRVPDGGATLMLLGLGLGALGVAGRKLRTA